MFSTGDPLPDSDGSFLFAALEFGEIAVNEDGTGVLVRVTLEALAKGTADLALVDVIVLDNAGLGYAIGSIEGARVEAGGACS